MGLLLNIPMYPIHSNVLILRHFFSTRDWNLTPCFKLLQNINPYKYKDKVYHCFVSVFNVIWMKTSCLSCLLYTRFCLSAGFMWLSDVSCTSSTSTWYRCLKIKLYLGQKLHSVVLNINIFYCCTYCCLHRMYFIITYVIVAFLIVMKRFSRNE